MAEIAFLEMAYQHNLRVTEEIRNQVTSLQAEVMAEREKYTSAIVREEKAIEAIREWDRKLDFHYQRKIAETLDNHLTVIQRDYEEKFRQLKANEEEAVRRDAAKRAEETKAAEEVERAKEAAVEAERAGNLLKAAKNDALVSEDNTMLERDIARPIRQIVGAVENVRDKTNEILRILNGRAVPKSVTIEEICAKKFISIYEARKTNSSIFACGRVIVNVSAQVPGVMKFVLAEFHKECMYTVPKYIKAIGFREKDGKLETTKEYLDRLESCMKLFGAIVQTEAQGVKNMYGLEHGWTWLARFLNTLPANVFTVVALEAFLEMAGFALHKKYKYQFQKVLTVISREFVPKLKASTENPRINSTVARLEDYIKSNKFLVEPEGWRLKKALLSNNAYL